MLRDPGLTEPDGGWGGGGKGVFWPNLKQNLLHQKTLYFNQTFSDISDEFIIHFLSLFWCVFPHFDQEFLAVV